MAAFPLQHCSEAESAVLFPGHRPHSFCSGVWWKRSLYFIFLLLCLCVSFVWGWIHARHEHMEVWGQFPGSRFSLSTLSEAAFYWCYAVYWRLAGWGVSRQFLGLHLPLPVGELLRLDTYSLFNMGYSSGHQACVLWSVEQSGWPYFPFSCCSLRHRDVLCSAFYCFPFWVNRR